MPPAGISASSPLLCDFIQNALLTLPKSVDPLRRCVDKPHELLAWHKLINEALSSATSQLAALDETGDIHHFSGTGGDYNELLGIAGTSALRRYRTFAVRTAAASSASPVLASAAGRLPSGIGGNGVAMRSNPDAAGGRVFGLPF
ncbi:unnamed protein product, partial [Protopolystoma xenopodis]